MHVEVVLPLGYAYKRQAMIGKSHDASMVRALFFLLFFYPNSSRHFLRSVVKHPRLDRR